MPAESYIGWYINPSSYCQWFKFLILGKVVVGIIEEVVLYLAKITNEVDNDIEPIIQNYQITQLSNRKQSLSKYDN